MELSHPGLQALVQRIFANAIKCIAATDLRTTGFAIQRFVVYLLSWWIHVSNFIFNYPNFLMLESRRKRLPRRAPLNIHRRRLSEKNVAEKIAKRITRRSFVRKLNLTHFHTSACMITVIRRQMTDITQPQTLMMPSILPWSSFWNNSISKEYVLCTFCVGVCCVCVCVGGCVFVGARVRVRVWV